MPHASLMKLSNVAISYLETFLREQVLRVLPFAASPFLRRTPPTP